VRDIESSVSRTIGRGIVGSEAAGPNAPNCARNTAMPQAASLSSAIADSAPSSPDHGSPEDAAATPTGWTASGRAYVVSIDDR
jgi:hypothetical protein